MKISKGDRVRSVQGGPWMEVIVASSQLAICTWDENGFTRQAVFGVDELHRQVSQQQQLQQSPYRGEGDSASSSH